MGNGVLSISKIIFQSENFKYVLKSFEINVKNIEYAELGIFTQWNVLNINICHVDKRIGVLGSAEAYSNLDTSPFCPEFQKHLPESSIFYNKETES